MAECRNKKDKVRVYSSWQANNQFSAHELTTTSVIFFHTTKKYDKYEALGRKEIRQMFVQKAI